MNSKRTPKRWLFHGILADTPISDEDTYYPAEQVIKILRIQSHPGIRILRLAVQELPERPKKRGENPANRGKNEG